MGAGGPKLSQIFVMHKGIQHVRFVAFVVLITGCGSGPTKVSETCPTRRRMKDSILVQVHLSAVKHSGPRDLPIGRVIVCSPSPSHFTKALEHLV